ncbi:MAG TPA: ABC transporter substrate-binding protein, partial [Thermomicrobiales bacterium]|nr:ABC transporter substrate-binding protein [Thermomicrobiales bacterium]
MTHSSTPFRDLVDQFRANRIDRRGFLQASAALGVAGGLASVVANAVSAQDATPASGETDAIGRPAANTADQERGAGGELRLISYQAATSLAAHGGQGSKDAYPGSLIMEPPLTYDDKGDIAPLLVEQAPTVDNGLLSEDLKTATLTFLPDLVWSDGEPVTANDLVFTWKWVTNPSNASINIDVWDTIESIEATDDKTAVVTFKNARVNWYEPFVGVSYGVLYPAHAFDNDPDNKNEAFATQPIGTGPFVIDSFEPNDIAVFSMNENYREANKPYFSSVTFKGGGDAIATGRAVVQTGEYDYAWNVQAEPEIIKQINESGEYGQLVGVRTSTTEVIYFNFSDPNMEVDGQRSQKDTPHPFFTDKAVRDAINLAIDRTLIAGEFYGEPDSATANVLSGNPTFESPNTSWEFDLDKAAQTLEDAGWVMDGDVRKKDGIALEFTFSTAANSVRQKTQAVVKDALEKIGFKVKIDQVDSAIFFDSSPGNDQGNTHFYSDMMMWSSGPGAPVSPQFMIKWYSGPDGRNIAQKENDWSGLNFQRYQNPDYDAIFEDLRSATTFDDAINLMISLNDTVIDDRAVVPLVARTFYYGIANRLNRTNMDMDNHFTGPFDNIANWNL